MAIFYNSFNFCNNKFEARNNVGLMGLVGGVRVRVRIRWACVRDGWILGARNLFLVVSKLVV